MKRAIIVLTAIMIGLTANLSASADYSVTTSEPLYPINPINYSTVQPYTPQYNTGYSTGYNQNPYQTQCVGQYTNPYAYRAWNGYGYNGYRNPYATYNPILNTLGNTTSTVGNIGRSLLYSLVRGGY